MRSRLTALILAIVLGILATAGVAVYLNIIAESSKADGRKINVYVAVKGIGPGKTGGQLLKDASIEKKEIPRRYLPADAVTSVGAINTKILASRLSEGETVTFSKFKTLGGAETLPHRLSGTRVAISIPVDSFSGVGGQINSGDQVMVFATVGTNDSSFTRIILHNVPVLTAPKEQKSKSSSSGGAQGQNKQSLTLEVDPKDLAKLVFAAEEGKLWLALQKPGDKYEDIPPTADTTTGTSFPESATLDSLITKP